MEPIVSLDLFIYIIEIVYETPVNGMQGHKKKNNSPIVLHKLNSLINQFPCIFLSVENSFL